jgi:hypothetical protein
MWPRSSETNEPKEDAHFRFVSACNSARKDSMDNECRFNPPEISEEMELFVCLHALDSAFDRILRALNMLNAALILSAESVHATNASIQAIRTAVNLELRETLGQSGLENFDEFSRKVREMETQLIAQCLAQTYGQNVPEVQA